MLIRMPSSPSPIRSATIPVLAFFTAGSVLTMEIVATRLLAPYVGVTLQTYTAIIGTVLAGISIGAFSGGRIADRVGPRRALGPVIVLGGALVLAALPALRLVGRWVDGDASVGAVMLAGGAFLLPAAILSMVSPMLIKFSITSLETAGAAVGRIEAAGTAGAIFGTFFAGFVLVAKLASDSILIVEGIALVLLGLVVHLALNRKVSKGLVGTAVIAVVAIGGTSWRDHKCEYETRYFCVNVSPDENLASGRYLNLDTLSHSYVDLADPTHLEFEYVEGVVAGIESVRPVGPLRALHIGGGGFTVPRYLHVTRPGSTNLVIERDAGLVRLDEQLLGLKLGGGLSTIAQDGRVAVRQQSSGDWDVVVGDAFGGEAVPWHLATKEFIQQIHTRLRPDGMYTLNVIDSPPSDGTPGKFVRAELATIGAVFEHVAVATSDWAWNGTAGDNFVVYASDSPIPEAKIQAKLDDGRSGWQIHGEADVRKWVGDAQVLTDRFAPVDQLLTVG
jgi:spermidine synthase